MSKTLLTGFPAEILIENTSDEHAIATDNGSRNKSVPLTFTGDIASQDLVAPAAGRRLVIKGITIIGDGNQGTVKVRRGAGNVTILPVYFSAQNRAGASGSLNIVLNVNEKVNVTATGRAASETFVGISYVEIY